MAGTRVLSLFVAVLFVLAGCNAFFSFNAFSGVDKPGVPDPSRYQGSGGLNNLQQDLQSQAIVDALKGDPETVATILGNLASEHNLVTPTSAEDQQAAILYAQLSLQATSGDELANNIVETVANNPSGNLQTLLASVVPADAAGNITKFTALVDGLHSALTMYENLGTHLDKNNPPPGMNMGDVAQKAAVALLMETIVAAVKASPAPAPAYTQAEATAQMFALINNQPNTVSGVNVNDPFSDMGNGNPAWLVHIYDSAGASYPP